MEKQHLLEVKDLHTSFNIPSGEVRSVNGVSFSLDKGEVLGIVGESGSGKSVTAYSIMQILEKPGRVIGGSIKFKGQELLNVPIKQLQKIRGEKISIIFQDSMSSLNPVWSIGNQLREVVEIHDHSALVKDRREKYEHALAIYNEEQSKRKEQLDSLKEEYKTSKNPAILERIGVLEDELKPFKEASDKAKWALDNYATDRALEMLKLVGINEPERRLKQYPFEFSGGMLQRIMIAMALICEPEIIIADEPTTALDVTIQAQILDLLLSIQKKMGMGIIIITHDLGVVAQICDRVNVMYAGRIVETGNVRDIFYNPKHEYTKGLINSIPKMGKRVDKLEPIKGNPVDVLCLPEGCSFAPRCDKCMKVCLKKYPSYINVDEHHKTACFAYLHEMLEAGSISEEEFNKYIDSCQEGNKAFTKISRLDVEHALQKYEIAKENLKNADKTQLSKDDYDILVYRANDAKQDLRRAKRDLSFARTNAHYGRGEKYSIDKNDVRKKIRHHLVEIKSIAHSMNEEQFQNYLDNLVISTTPVNHDVTKESIQNIKEEIKNTRENIRISDFECREDRIKALVELDNLQIKLLNARDDLRWANYINRKLVPTKDRLTRIYERIKREGEENGK